MNNDPKFSASTWSYPWAPWGTCKRSDCLYQSVRCEYGLCERCCKKFHHGVSNHSMPPAWRIKTFEPETGGALYDPLPVHYHDPAPKEPKLGNMEEIEEMERHTTFRQVEDKWFTP